MMISASGKVAQARCQQQISARRGPPATRTTRNPRISTSGPGPFAPSPLDLLPREVPAPKIPPIALRISARPGLVLECLYLRQEILTTTDDSKKARCVNKLTHHAFTAFDNLEKEDDISYQCLHDLEKSDAKIKALKDDLAKKTDSLSTISESLKAEKILTAKTSAELKEMEEKLKAKEQELAKVKRWALESIHNPFDGPITHPTRSQSSASADTSSDEITPLVTRPNSPEDQMAYAELRMSLEEVAERYRLEEENNVLLEVCTSMVDQLGQLNQHLAEKEMTRLAQLGGFSVPHPHWSDEEERPRRVSPESLPLPIGHERACRRQAQHS
ncbi:hypothetical protein L873DRAFT_1848732 [Choiromyces venosus 120613-1]|uniref:Uncharacterized protein n=1 Tax=Choiromyces venosus 120613-1 TaxID=1336337 RepID=A0A3N4IXM5_9PEZI|nr:hypothetical protein L873DRAFT_1848732 [Choiromyces venosus 120613-1]